MIARIAALTALPSPLIRMIARQKFRFYAQSETLLEYVLRGLSHIAVLDEERERFSFTNLATQPKFNVDCVIVTGGIDVDSAGDYYAFLGALVETLTTQFGEVLIERSDNDESPSNAATGYLRYPDSISH